MSDRRKRTIRRLGVLLLLALFLGAIPLAMRRAYYARLWKVVESDITLAEGELSDDAREHLRRLARDSRGKLELSKGAAYAETLPRLKHPHPKVQAFAIELIAAWRLPQSAPVLQAYIRDTTDPVLRERASSALRNLDRPAE